MKEDFFRLDSEAIETVKNFCYLGVELSSKGIATTRHVEERVRKARLAFSTIPKPRDLSLRTALALFEMKIAPIASYAIQLT